VKNKENTENTLLTGLQTSITPLLSTLVVMCTGNPQVFFAVPVPVPMETHTHDCGYGFLVGLQESYLQVWWVQTCGRYTKVTQYIQDQIWLYSIHPFGSSSSSSPSTSGILITASTSSSLTYPSLLAHCEGDL
jgi:hypothetical protein